MTKFIVTFLMNEKGALKFSNLLCIFTLNKNLIKHNYYNDEGSLYLQVLILGPTIYYKDVLKSLITNNIVHRYINTAIPKSFKHVCQKVVAFFIFLLIIWKTFQINLLLNFKIQKSWNPGNLGNKKLIKHASNNNIDLMLIEQLY